MSLPMIATKRQRKPAKNNNEIRKLHNWPKAIDAGSADSFSGKNYIIYGTEDTPTNVHMLRQQKWENNIISGNFVLFQMRTSAGEILYILC